MYIDATHFYGYAVSKFLATRKIQMDRFKLKIGNFHIMVSYWYC